jgi:8-oxo-dGTP pyrophosphatase MutT (NUDIX family)
MPKSNYPIPGNALVLFNPAGRVFLAERVSDTEGGVFGCPGGNCELGQDPTAAVLAETWEETHLRPRDVTPIPLVHSVYDGVDQYICHYFTGLTDEARIDFVEHKDGRPKCKGWRAFSLAEAERLPLMVGTLDALRLAFDLRTGRPPPPLRIVHFDLTAGRRPRP